MNTPKEVDQVPTSDYFSGKWNIVVATPLGKKSVILDIVVEDGMLKGQATYDGYTAVFMNPTIVDQQLRWSHSVTKPMPLTIHFAVTAAGNFMTGTAKAEAFPDSQIIGERLITSNSELD